MTEEVDALLGRVATELDRGGSAARVIAGSTLRITAGRSRGYDLDSVDIFFSRFLDPSSDQGSSWKSSSVGMGGAPVTVWQGGPAGNWFDRSRSFSDDCSDTWSRFDQLDGGYFRLRSSGATRRLHGEGDQVLVTTQTQFLYRWMAHGGRVTKKATVGDVSFTKRTVRPDPDTQARINEARYGGFSPAAHELGQSPGRKRSVYDLYDFEWVNERTGEITLWQFGTNFGRRALGMIEFSDGTLWRFPVRGNPFDRAIMTAVDLRGSACVRYRAPNSRSYLPGIPPLYLPALEIVVAPQLSLAPDRLLAITLAAPWLRGYFDGPGGR